MKFKLSNFKWENQVGEYRYIASLESTQDNFILQFKTNSLNFDSKDLLFMDATLYKDGETIANWDTWGYKREVTSWVKELVHNSEIYLNCTFAFHGYFMMKDLK